MHDPAAYTVRVDRGDGKDGAATGRVAEEDCLGDAEFVEEVDDLAADELWCYCCVGFFRDFCPGEAWVVDGITS